MQSGMQSGDIDEEVEMEDEFHNMYSSLPLTQILVKLAQRYSTKMYQHKDVARGCRQWMHCGDAGWGCRVGVHSGDAYEEVEMEDEFHYVVFFSSTDTNTW